MVASSTTDIRSHALACRDAARQLAQLSASAKADLLDAMAAALEADTDAILAANARDLAAASAVTFGRAS